MSATSAETGPISDTRARPLLDRVLVAIPIVGLALVVLTFYAIEAWSRKTP